MLKINSFNINSTRFAGQFNGTKQNAAPQCTPAQNRASLSYQGLNPAKTEGKNAGLSDYLQNNSSCTGSLPAGWNSAYALTFRGGRRYLTLQEQFDRLNPENLSRNVLSEINAALERKIGENLYDIHKKVYGPLLECETLEAAKAMYPEFQDVIDAKELDDDKLSPTLKKIKDGEIEGISLDNLTLFLLKTYYGKGISPNSRDKYFNLSKDATGKIFEILNIERLDGQYLRLVGDCSPEKRDRVSKSWTDEKRAKHAEVANSVWSDEDLRAAQSRRRLEWLKEHPESVEEMTRRLRNVVLTDEIRDKISAGCRAHYAAHPERREAQQEAWAAHTEIKVAMENIAHNEFPFIGKIINKQRRGLALTEKEAIYMNSYYKRCTEIIPGFHKTVGKTYSEIYAKKKKQIVDGEDVG